jgi:hypothetical protein
MLHNVYRCFPGGKHKALTMSYDDGRTYDRRLVELFNKYGIKGTFHLNSGFLGDDSHIARSEVKSLYAGHEVACHTVTHPTIARCAITDVVRQVLDDRQDLESLTCYPVRGLSYPNGSYSETIKSVLPSLGIAYSRVVGDTDSFELPGDLYEWKSTCHHTHRLLENANAFLSLHKTQYLYLMYVWGHSYEFNDSGNWSLMEDFCKLAGNKEDTYYATNIQIVDYFHLCDELRFSADGSFVCNPGADSAFLSVDDTIVEIPGGQCITLF